MRHVVSRPLGSRAVRRACRTTASAMRAVTRRRAAMGGNRLPASTSSWRSWSARHSRGGARTSPSVTSRASDSSAPRPTPGKMKALLPWPMRIVRPSDARRARRGCPWPPARGRPSRRARPRARLGLAGRVRQREDQRPLDVARHLAHDLLREGAGAPETPMSTVGWSARTTASRSRGPAGRKPCARRQRARPGELAPVVLRRASRPRRRRPWCRGRRPPRDVSSAPAAPARRERVAQQARDADARRARAQDDDALPRPAARPSARAAREDPGQRPWPPCPGCRR